MELPKGIRTVTSLRTASNEEVNVDSSGRLISHEFIKMRGPGRPRFDEIPDRPSPPVLPLQYDSKIKMKDLEKFWVLSAVKQCNGSIGHAAKILGMARETVYRKVRAWNK